MKKTFFILPFLFLLMSQSNQRQLGVINGITNFFESPFEYIANSIANTKYEKLADRTLSQTANISREVNCSVDGLPLPESSISDLLNTPHFTCKCEPWGNCTKSACSCDILCPDNFNIFRTGMNTVQDLTTPENSLAFRNYVDSEPVNGRIRSTDGICWGHASVTSKFNRLGFFKPDVKPPYRLTSTDPQERRQAIKFYRSIIDDIVHNKATDIPGYRNLMEFSDDPELSNYFKDKVTREWADRAMSWQGLRVAINAKASPKEHNDFIFAEVRRRLSLNQQPNLIFTRAGRRFETHASLVSHAGEKYGKQVLCMRDNNYSEYENAACVSYMYINDKGEMVSVYRQMEETVGAVDLAFNDKRDAVKQVKSLQKRCSVEKTCR